MAIVRDRIVKGARQNSVGVAVAQVIESQKRRPANARVRVIDREPLKIGKRFCCVEHV